MLDETDYKVIDFTLDALQGIMNVGIQISSDNMEDSNQFAEYVEHAGGLQKLEQLTYCENSPIASKASKLISKFFNIDEESRLQSNSINGNSNIDVVRNQNSFIFDPNTNKFQFTH